MNNELCSTIISLENEISDLKSIDVSVTEQQKQLKLLHKQLKRETKCSCGQKLIKFMHNCPSSNNYPEIFGCPRCDDNCAFCKES